MQAVQNKPDLFSMFRKSTGENQNIIKVCKDAVAEEIMEDVIHKRLKHTESISEPKSNNFVLEVSACDLERNFLFIAFPDTD